MAELYLVEFKGHRREFYYNKFYHSLTLSEYVVVEAERGEDIGVLVHKVDRELVFPTTNRPRSILRPASKADIERVKELRENEKTYKGEVEVLVAKHGLPMKIVDVECQFDWNKVTIYFTADHRVDFRELVKDLAARYKTRIELRQIGVRDEAKRLGGFGICGLPQCCSTFLREFAPITTQHAREQELPLNPVKISGNCGRLLCCLRFEAETYVQCRRRFPPVGALVKTKMGDGEIERIDIFHEEAVVRDEENNRFRVHPTDILEVLYEKREKKEVPSQAYLDLGNGSLEEGETEEVLKKLEDTTDEDANRQSGDPSS